MFKAILVGIFVFAVSWVAIADPVEFSCKNCDISEVIAKYSKLSKRTIVIDPNVRGKVNILTSDKVSLDEAFHLLSQSLAANGYAFVGEGEDLQLMSSRQAARSNIPVYNTLPPLKPERLVTWVRVLKKMKSDQVAQIKMLASRDGELQILTSPERIVMTDYTGNIQRVAKLIDELDR